MPKSVTRTLRIDEELDRAVARRASEEHASVNFVINRNLRKYIDWDIPMTDYGMVIAPKRLLDKLALRTSGEALEQDGREVARDFVKPIAIHLVGEFSVSSAVEVLRRSSLYSGRFLFDFAEGKDSRSHVLIIRHDNGRVWSRYYFGVIDETFRVLLGEDLKTEQTEGLVVAQLKAR